MRAVIVQGASIQNKEVVDARAEDRKSNEVDTEDGVEVSLQLPDTYSNSWA